MSESGHGHTEDHGKNSGTGKGWGLLILVGMLGIALFAYLFKSPSDDKKDNVNSNTSIKTQQTSGYKGTWVVKRRETIRLTPEYGETHYILFTDGFDTEGASVPYRIINKEGVEASGGISENISSKLPNGNTELRFKSTNGDLGEVVLVVYELK